jgi:hypothetical protein
MMYVRLILKNAGAGDKIEGPAVYDVAGKRIGQVVYEMVNVSAAAEKSIADHGGTVPPDWRVIEDCRTEDP